MRIKEPSGSCAGKQLAIRVRGDGTQAMVRILDHSGSIVLRLPEFRKAMVGFRLAVNVRKSVSAVVARYFHTAWAKTCLSRDVVYPDTFYQRRCFERSLR